MLPPLPARKSYDDVPRDSLAYALFLNPLMEVDPLDNNNDEPPTLKALTARLKHMPGKHDQSAHGKPGRVGSAFRGAYSAARAGGASHVEARNQAKSAAEQVRETIRGEKRAERIANPKSKRVAPPRAETPTTPTTPTAPTTSPRAETPATTKWQSFLDKSKAEYAAAQDAYQAAISDKNATMESLTAAQRARDAAGDKWTRDQATANQMAAVESAAPPPRTTTPTTPTTPTAPTKQTRVAEINDRIAKNEATSRDLVERDRVARDAEDYTAQNQIRAEQIRVDAERKALFAERAAIKREGKPLTYAQTVAEIQRQVAEMQATRTPVTTPTPPAPETQRERRARVAQQEQARTDARDSFQTPEQRQAERDAATQRVAQRRAERAATPTTPTTPTTSRTRQGELQDAMASGVTERRAISTRLEQIQQEMAKYTTPDSPYNSDDPRYERLRAERATLRARDGTLEADYDKQLTELQKLQAQPRTPTPTTPTAPTSGRALSDVQVTSSRPTINKERYGPNKGQENMRTVDVSVSGNYDGRAQPFTAYRFVSLDKGKTWNATNYTTGTTSSFTGSLKQAVQAVQRRFAENPPTVEQAEQARNVYSTTKADDSVGGTPRKYGARAGEVIAGNLGRDTGGKFTRVGEDATSVIRAAINRGFASAAGGGKRGAKRAAVSDAQKKRQQADTGAGVMDALGFDASDWDYLASDKPQDASDPQFTRLIEQGLMDNVDGMAYPSALGRKVAAAAGAGNEDKAKELLARDTAKRSARQAKMDAQISAYDEVINDETASPRARAIAARRRTMLIGQSGTSTKATDSVNLYMQGNDEPYAINTSNDIAGAYHKRIVEQDGPEGLDDFKAELIAIAKRKGPDYVRKLPQKWKDEIKSNTTKASDGYAPPDGVRAQAKRGLALRSEFGRGGTSVGIARARDLSNGKRMSRDTIMRMVSFFARHAVDKRPDWGNPSKPSNGYIAHLLWGGDAGKSWANKIANQIKAGE